MTARCVALEKASGNPRFAWDSYRRFITMYSNVVLGVEHALFEAELERAKERLGKHQDTELAAEDWKTLVAAFKEIVQEETGHAFPQEPMDQLWGAIRAVFESWNTARAITYRRLHRIPDDWGTGVNVQSMVFGNMGDDCGTGVAFTRDPATGEKLFYGEYLINAQGEDVVAGIRTPQPITRAQADGTGLKSLEEAMPAAFTELDATCKRLETHFKDMQDIEFTIERGKLYLLQTRNGKRTAMAGIRIAIDMVDEGLIDSRTALKRIDADSLSQLLAPVFDPKEKDRLRKEGQLLTKGLNAGPGRRHGPHRPHRRAGGADGPGGPCGAGARGDEPGGYLGHGGLPGHPHGARRHDQPCGRGGPRHGQALRLRCLGGADRRGARRGQGGRA